MMRLVACAPIPGAFWLFWLVLACVLPLLPWTIVLRVVGALLLGPHMYLVGSKARRVAAEEEAAAAKAIEDEAALQKRYAEATDRDAFQILRDECEKADAAADKAEMEVATAAAEERKRMTPAQLRLTNANAAARKCSGNLLLVQVSCASHGLYGPTSVLSPAVYPA